MERLYLQLEKEDFMNGCKIIRLYRDSEDEI
jgi:hypothetical protein